MATTTNGDNCQVRARSCCRVLRVEPLRSAGASVQLGLRVLLERRRGGGPRSSVHLRSHDVRIATGNAPGSRSASRNLAVDSEPWPRPRLLSYGPAPWSRVRGTCIRSWRDTTLGQLCLAPQRTLVAASAHEHLFDVLPARLHLSTRRLTRTFTVGVDYSVNDWYVNSDSIHRIRFLLHGGIASEVGSRDKDSRGCIG